MINSKISGVGVYIPQIEISNEYVLNRLEQASSPYLLKDELTTLLDKAVFKINKAGCNTRFWAAKNEHCSDLGYKASLEALSGAGIEAGELDAMFFAGMGHDLVEPATGHILKDLLEATNCNYVLDTQDGCTSFMKTIQLADGLIKTGTYKKILIATGEITHQWADFTCKTIEELAWKIAALTIGDGGGAVIMEKTEESIYDNSMQFDYEVANGQYSQTCTVGLTYKAGEFNKMLTHSKRLILAGEECGKILFNRIFKPGDQFDSFIYHNVGSEVDRIMNGLLKNAGVILPDHCSFFADYGNIGAASFPVALHTSREKGLLKRGNHTLFCCPASGPQVGVMRFKY